MGISPLSAHAQAHSGVLGAGGRTATTYAPGLSRHANPARTAPPPAPSLGRNREAAIARAFDAMVYRPLGQKTGPSPGAAQQLEFDFVFDARAEALVLFQQRMAATAQGLPDAEQATLVELSREVAARFQVSMSVSVSALGGFASTTEAAGNHSDLLQRFSDLTQRLMELAGEMFSEVFEYLGAFFRGGPESRDFNDMARQLLDNLLADLFGGQGGGAPATGGQVQLEFRFSFEMSLEVSVTQGEVQQGDPLVLDLDGDGIELTRYTAGARFDLMGNAQSVRTALVTGGDAFLAIDRDGDGRITNGRELFGEQNGATNGFEELRKLDSNGDGVIDRLDRDFDKLLLWRDNGNGISEPGELLTLGQAGIASISLGYQNVDQAASGGNRIAQIAAFTFTDGRVGRAADALLNYTV